VAFQSASTKGISSPLCSLVPLSEHSVQFIRQPFRGSFDVMHCRIAHYLACSDLLVNISQCCNTYRYVVCKLSCFAQFMDM